MAKRIKYPVGIQTFEKIIKEGYAYVDKTALIYELVTTGQYYFLARPRRFGKSLLLSTIQAYFEGKKELFEGLAISHLEEFWEKYPVIRLDLSAYNPKIEGHIEMILDTQLSRYEEIYGIQRHDISSDQRLNRLIFSLFQKTGKGVVVLIDEYDAPLTAHISDPMLFEDRRNILHSVYSNLKSMDEYLKFVMLTGVTRYSKTSVFSGLNNLEDISTDYNFSTICGITEVEINEYLQQGIDEFAYDMGMESAKLMSELKVHYDGYHFTKDKTDLYNPFSLIQVLKKKDFGLFWYQSGKATLIVNLIKDTPHLLSRELNRSVGESLLSEIDIATTSPTALMFQAGYLTIKEWDPATKMYTLGIPNQEVKEGLYADLAVAVLGVAPAVLSTSVWEVKSLLMKGHPEEAFERLKSFLGGIPYLVTQNKTEIFYENNLFLILSLIGIDTTVELHTSEGRIDMVLKFPDYIYVIELKLDSTAKEAMNQIDTNHYTVPFAFDGRKIIKVGINFSSKTRNITEVLTSPI
ncbi:MAG: ATP-binding protein [Muribaculaceae bacterium]|nr:ATP-binding protein [Muribaculaceae bacterium]